MGPSEEDAEAGPHPAWCVWVAATLRAQTSSWMIKSQVNNQSVYWIHTFLILINTDKLPSSKAAPINNSLQEIVRDFASSHNHWQCAIKCINTCGAGRWKWHPVLKLNTVPGLCLSWRSHSFPRGVIYLFFLWFLLFNIKYSLHLDFNQGIYCMGWYLFFWANILFADPLPLPTHTLDHLFSIYPSSYHVRQGVCVTHWAPTCLQVFCAGLCPGPAACCCNHWGFTTISLIGLKIRWHG